MQKKLIVIFSVVGVLLVLAGGVWYLKMRASSPAIVSPDGAGKPPTTAPKFLTWNDPAGFTFQYGVNLNIDNNPEDMVNYANLEIVEPGKEGKILVLASDSQYKDVNEWARKDVEVKEGNAVDAVFGGKPAKKISLAGSDKIVVGAIDDKILFTVELVSSGSATMVQNFETIISSFVFVYPTGVPKSSAGSGFSTGSDIIEEEEIIE